MLLAVATVGLSVQAWGNSSAQGEATAAAQSVAQAADADIDVGDSLMNFAESTGFVGLVQDWRCIVMLLIACVLLYLAIVKQYEPLLLLPMTNLNLNNQSMRTFAKGNATKLRLI